MERPEQLTGTKSRSRNKVMVKEVEEEEEEREEIGNVNRMGKRARKKSAGRKKR